MFEKEPLISQALVRETVSAARNRLYAARAAKEGNVPLARLLTALADSEEVHTRRALFHLRGKIGETEEHLRTLAKEKFRFFAETFPRIATRLLAEGHETGAEAFEQFGEVARNHYDLLAREDLGDAVFHVCQVCGYIAVDELPMKCPVCGALPVKFRRSG